MANKLRVWTKVIQGSCSIEKELEIDVEHLSMETPLQLIKEVFETRIDVIEEEE